MTNRDQSPFYKAAAHQLDTASINKNYRQGSTSEKISLSKLLIIGTLTLLIYIIPWVFTITTQEFYEITKNYLLLVGGSILIMIWGVTTIIKKKVILYKTPIDLAIFAGLFSIILSTIFSISNDTSIWGYQMRMTGGLISYLLLISIYYLIINTVQSKETIKFLLKAVVYSITLLGTFTLLKAFNVFDGLFSRLSLINPNLDFLNSPLFTPTGNPNSLTFIFIIALPLSLFIFINKKRPSVIDTIVGLLASAILVMACAVTSITTGTDWPRLITWLLIAGIVITALIYSFKIPTKNSGRTAVHVVIILLTIFGFFFANDSNFRVKLNDNLNFSRYYDVPFQTSWQVLTGTYNKYSLKSLLIGTGPDTYAYEFPQFRPIEQNFQSNWVDNYTRSNTQIESTLITSGLLGFASFILLGYFIIKFLKTKIFRPEIILKKRSLFSMAMVMIVFLVSYFLTYHSITLLFFFWIIFALLFKFYTIIYTKEESRYEADFKIVNRANPGKEGSLAPYIFTGILITAALTMIFFVTINFNAETYYNNGLKLSANNDFDNSYDKFVAAVNLNSNRDYYHREIATVALNKLDAVILTAQLNVAKTTPEEAQQNQTIQDYLLTLINSEINKAILLNPENHENWQRAAVIYKKLTELSQGKQFGNETLQAIQKAISLNPNNPDNFLLLGYIYQYNADPQLKAIAEKAYLKAYDLQPSYALSIIQFGSYLEYIEKFDDAKKLYTVSLDKFYPTDSSVNTFLQQKIAAMNEKIKE